MYVMFVILRTFAEAEMGKFYVVTWLEHNLY